MKRLLILCVCFYSYALSAQELYIHTEPASNMPKGSVGIRFTDRIIKQNDEVNTWLVPEIMLGVNKDLMVHFGGYTSDHQHRNIALNGGYIYAKYRFYANDEVQKHLRLAVFGKLARSALYNSENNQFTKGEMFSADLDGYYSGYELGLVATQLFHKLALSFSTYYTKIGDYAGKWKSYSGNGVLWGLSAGYLLLPRHYTNYKQLNLNLYAEILGYYNTNIDAGNALRVVPENHFAEGAPGIQFIVNSQTRIDLSYRFRLYSYSPSQQNNYMVLLRLEHTIFNRW